MPFTTTPFEQVVLASSLALANTVYATSMLRWTTAASRLDPASTIHSASPLTVSRIERIKFILGMASAVGNVAALPLWIAMSAPMLCFLTCSTVMAILESRLLYGPPLPKLLSPLIKRQ